MIIVPMHQCINAPMQQLVQQIQKQIQGNDNNNNNNNKNNNSNMKDHENQLLSSFRSMKKQP
jgi:phosphotransferase system  glucose/maltose/N-acetylglucosamine-specific IIC component